MKVFLIVFCSFVKLYHPILWKQHAKDKFSIIFPFILKFTLEVRKVRIYFDIFRAENKFKPIYYQNIYSLMWLDGSNNKT